MTNNLRNVAIIAHVDHGKTTLIDALLTQSGSVNRRNEQQSRLMDSNELEKERGITILSKHTTLTWKGTRINIVDTPGHADFGGEVERVMSMVDGVLLLVDAVDGPMPQTRFVTQKAMQRGLCPIVVVNKVDRSGARPDWVVDQTFDLFDKLGATEEQLDFPVIYASALNGSSGLEPDTMQDNMEILFDAITRYVPVPDVDKVGPFQMQISSLDYDSYAGVIGIGRIQRGQIKVQQPLVLLRDETAPRNVRILQLFGHKGLERVEIKTAEAGDIVVITGVDKLRISDTLCDREHPESLPALTVDQPTVSMMFQVNTSPFSGRDGRFLTSRQIRERLDTELIHNVALAVEDTGDADKFLVCGRGELHLSILIETMRREGFELAVSRPHVIQREIDGVLCEPVESFSVDLEEAYQGTVMEKLGLRGADMQQIEPDGKGRVRLAGEIPARGLIGFRSEFLSSTAGTGILASNHAHYAPVRRGNFGQRQQGVLIANGQGKALGYSLFNLQERGRLMVGHGDDVYEGMVIGEHSRGNDLIVNPLKGKQLTNVRAAGTDENIVLTTPIRFTLEQALEYIDDDELVEVTPAAIRIRKKHLKEHDRKRAARSKA